MKKLSLSVVAMVFQLFGAYAQQTDNSTYKNANLKLEETDIVSSYYGQTGNHSAITGGTGTQQLTDFGTAIDLKFVNWDAFDRKHTLTAEFGIDHHSAASAAFVNTSGASRLGGTRIYPSVIYTSEDEAKRTTWAFGASYSSEYTYHSIGANVAFTKKSADNNREFTIKGQVYVDRVKLVEPSELRPVVTTNTRASREDDRGLTPTSPRNTGDLSLSLSQIVNKRLQVALVSDVVGQQGYLSLPFHRVYFLDRSVHLEKLPDTRLKLPVGLRLNYFLGDKVILRSYYRYYIDSWGVKSHTASIETPVKISPFFSVSPFYRYYKQTAADYFAPYKTHTAADAYYTSNYDYAAFSADYAGINFRIAPPKGVFGSKHFNMLELRYGFYKQTTGLQAQQVTMNLRFK